MLTYFNKQKLLNCTNQDDFEPEKLMETLTNGQSFLLDKTTVRRDYSGKHPVELFVEQFI